jgi:hypothetical protein
MQVRSETNLQLWSVRESISVKKICNKVNKSEEWLLAPPVYSLRGTHACGELPFAEPSRAEHTSTRDGYTANSITQYTPATLSPSSETSSRSASQNFPFMKPKDLPPVHQSPPLVSNLRGITAI